MRLGAGEFGAVALSGVRVAFASLALVPLVALRGEWPALRRHWRPLLAVGIVNSALPFVAYSHAALSITAGLSSIFNATSPLWGALIAWLWLHDRPGRHRAIGLAIGFAGVIWLAWDKAGLRADAPAGSAAWAIAACLGATLCYGLGVNVAKRYLAGVPPMAVAGGSQAAAALVLLPLSAWQWPAQRAVGAGLVVGRGARRRLHGPRLPAVLPPHRARRAGEGDLGDLPDPAVRGAVGLGLPRRGTDAGDGRRRRSSIVHRHGAGHWVVDAARTRQHDAAADRLRAASTCPTEKSLPQRSTPRTSHSGRWAKFTATPVLPSTGRKLRSKSDVDGM